MIFFTIALNRGYPILSKKDNSLQHSKKAMQLIDVSLPSGSLHTNLTVLYSLFLYAIIIETTKKETAMYRIFIIEDDRTIANAVKNHLEKWGFEARCTENFKDIMAEFSELSPHLVLMDIGLPFYNGFYHCTEIRKVS